MDTLNLWSLADMCIPNFIGVYPLDKIPTYLKPPSNFIVNTHTKNLPGEHWVAVSYQKDGRVYAFDSFGHYYPSMLKKRLLRLSRTAPVWYNKIQYQESDENTCGHYCLAWLIDMSKLLPSVRCYYD